MVIDQLFDNLPDTPKPYQHWVCDPAKLILTSKF
jgi:hypothetical protein